MRPNLNYFRPAMKLESFLISASDAPMPFGGITPIFQPKEPPLVTLAAMVSAAFLSPLYFLATSIHAGPTTFLSIAWQEPHFALPSAGMSTAKAEPAIIRLDAAIILVIKDFILLSVQVD